MSFEILIGTAATSTCNFLCLIGQPCDRSYCANFNWPTASPQSQTPYAAQRELPVAAGTNTVYLNFNNTSAQTGITCYASLSVTFNADDLP